MAEPGRQAVAGIVLHRALFGGGAKRFRNALGSVIVVGRKGHADMAIVENRVVLAVSFLDLVQRLRDEERLKSSEERRVGKACVSTCRSRWSPTNSKKKEIYTRNYNQHEKRDTQNKKQQ